jgi:pilus assembly protein CpaE
MTIALPRNKQPDAADGTTAELVAFVGDSHSEETIRRLVEEQKLSAAIVRRGNCRDAIAYLKRSDSPRTVIIDLSDSEMPLGDMDEAIGLCDPNTVVIAIGSQNDVGLYRDLSIFGVADYILKPVSFEMLRRVVSIQSGRVFRPDQRPRVGKVICVTGARGGVGVTTFTASLAWQLSAAAGRSVVLIDLDLQCGALTLMLGLKKSSGFVDALRNPHRVDDLFLDRAMIKKAEKLMVLSAEEPLDDDLAFDLDGLDAVLRLLQQRFHYVLIDLPRRPGALYRQVLERAALQVVVATPTLAAVRDSLRIARLAGREDPGQRSLLVVNHVCPAGRGEISRQEFEKTIGGRVDYEIAFSPAAVAADNGGELLVNRDRAFAAVLDRMINELLGRSPAPEPKVRRLLRWRR